MKVLLINGSPKANGSTNRILEEVAKSLNENGVDSNIMHIGNKPIPGCIGCGACRKSGTNRCQYCNDIVNTTLDTIEEYDGIVVGSPVHFAGASGAVTSYLDRLFYAGSGLLTHKLGASVVAVRRAGSTATLDQLNKYFSFAQMPIVTSKYWNMVHGNTPKDMELDTEGMESMRVLGTNMAWLLKCIEAGKNSGVATPEVKPYEKLQFRG